MATPLSEVITYLSFTGDIPVDGEHTTLKTLLQEFGSISISIFCNQNASLIIQFSNDGINYDYNSKNSILANTTSAITSTILGKWGRIQLINTSREILTARFSTYAQVIPIAIQSQLESENNSYPIVNVDNLSGTLFNDLRIGEREPLYQHNFTYSSTIGGLLQGADRNITQIYGGGSSPILSPTIINGNTLTLSNIFNTPSNGYNYIQGRPTVSSSGNSVYIEMSCAFKTSGYINADLFGFDMMLCGMGYIDDTNNIIDGFYLGYPESPIAPAPIVDELAFIIYYNGNYLGIERSKWSFDRLDGNGASGVLLDPTKLSTWRIRTAIGTSVYLEYKNPFDNEYIPCHRIQLENLFITSLVKAPSYSFNIYNKKTTGATGDLASNEVGPTTDNVVIGVEVGKKVLARLESYSINSGVVLVSPTTETEIISIRNGNLINGINNRGIIDAIDSYINNEGNAFCIIKIYKNGTFNTPIWTVKDAIYEPTETSFGFYNLGTGYEVGSTLINSNSVGIINVDNYNTDITPNETLTFTVYSSQSASIYLLLNYKLVL